MIISLENAPKSRTLQPESVVFDFLVFKLAAACNINCNYCYWFRDKSAYALPKVLPEEIETCFLEELGHHLVTHKPPQFSILFHGGEPLLFGKRRMRALCKALQGLQQQTGIPIPKSITTNGILIDEEWCSLFRECNINVTLSIDGVEEQHDARRVDFQGRGTFKQVIEALHTLRKGGVEPAVLAVCNPLADPEDLCRFFVDVLQIRRFDVLVPDATHEDQVLSIENYYNKLFDLWFDKYAEMGVEIRFVQNLVRSLLGLGSTTKAIGYGPLTILTLSTDGALEPLDVLRIAGDGLTRTAYNVRTHHFQEAKGDRNWLAALDASLHLSEVCNKCEFREACGGGYLPSRWSKNRGFDNPSVYCQDLKNLFRHVRSRVLPTLYVARG